jgi:hypothetical protein
VLILGRMAVLQAASRKAAGPKDYKVPTLGRLRRGTSRLGQLQWAESSRSFESLWRSVLRISPSVLIKITQGGREGGRTCHEGLSFIPPAAGNAVTIIGYTFGRWNTYRSPTFPAIASSTFSPFRANQWKAHGIDHDSACGR